MLAAQRRDLLLERLRSDGQVVAKHLAAELGISEERDASADNPTVRSLDVPIIRAR